MIAVQKIKNATTATAAFTVLAFLYFPLVIIIWYSFNDDPTNSFPIRNYSFKWYSILANDAELLRTVKNSVTVAIIATLSALCIGLPASYGMHKFSFPGKKLLERTILMPITLPGIVTGVSMLSFFPLIGVHLSLTAVAIGHVTFLIAIVITQLLARFKRLDPFLEQAAFDLGATPAKAFFTVILPNIRTAIIGAVLLCLVLSMDEIPVTFFLIARENTLPIQIYGMMRRGITPEVNAISTLIFLVSATAILLSMRLNKQES
jgi:spermidine/putrescine transport system permease protein